MSRTEGAEEQVAAGAERLDPCVICQLGSEPVVLAATSHMTA